MTFVGKAQSLEMEGHHIYNIVSFIVAVVT